MSPAANTPGMFVSMVWDTLISPFSMSRPHWAIAPSEEMKPSWNHAVDGDALLFLTLIVEDGRGLDRVAALVGLGHSAGAWPHFPKGVPRVILMLHRRDGSRALAATDHEDEPG